MEANCVLCKVITEYVYIMQINFSLQRVKRISVFEDFPEEFFCNSSISDNCCLGRSINKT
jgi:hypothetical protein